MAAVETPAGAARAWRLRGADLDLTRPALMGILNLTPDSFSDGGRYTGPESRRRRIRSLVEQGARIIDVGGESTRPGAEPIDAGEEWRRVEPGIQAALGAGALVSVDTSKSVIARKALQLGAHIVNDVTALSDPDMAGVVREFGAGVVLMHMQGDPRTMQDNPRYQNVVEDTLAFLREKRDAAVEAGVPAEAVALDPGIGFGKTLEHNLTLLRHLDKLVALRHPVVLGASRKRFIGLLTGVERPEDRAPGSAAVAQAARRRGVQVFRVHDVGLTRQALTVAEALERG